MGKQCKQQLNFDHHECHLHHHHEMFSEDQSPVAIAHVAALAVVDLKWCFYFVGTLQSV